VRMSPACRVLVSSSFIPVDGAQQRALAAARRPMKAVMRLGATASETSRKAWSSRTRTRTARWPPPGSSIRTPRDVGLRPGFGRCGEYLRRDVVLDQLAQVEEGVKSETRAACCSLWVTMTTVKSRFSSWTSSSMDCVAMGSRADVGSSSSRTRGRRDGAGDAEALLLPARQGERARVEAVLDLVHRAGARSARSTGSAASVVTAARSRAARPPRCRRWTSSGTGSAAETPCPIRRRTLTGSVPSA